MLDWAGFKSAVSYTFDDGQPSQIEHYAELQATGVRLTFFVNSGSATWETGFVSTFSQAARDGHEIGNHTAHHCHADPDGTLHGIDRRAACPGASAAAELDDCTAFIRSKLGVSQVWTAASPFGDAGFTSAIGERFFLGRGATGGTVVPNDDSDPLALPMWGPAENDGVAEFNATVDDARSGGQWVILLLHSIAPTTSAWFATVDIGAITGSIAHAKSLGDVWIDSMANVGRVLAWPEGVLLGDPHDDATAGEGQPRSRLRHGPGPCRRTFRRGGFCASRSTAARCPSAASR